MPKVQSTAKILYGIYFALTVLEVVFLLLGGMPLFESMLTAFGTAGTGGFGFKNDSFTSFSPYIQWVVTIFMILFGVNFNAYFLLLLRKFNRAISEEVRGYFAIILVAIGIITANIYSFITALAKRCVRQPFRWAPSSRPLAFPAVTLTCGPPSPKKFWWCSCSLVPAQAAPAAASR